jgi:hypothetical protein
MAATTATRSVLVKTRDGDKIVEGVPANAKITFGPIQPGKEGHYGGAGNCLRIYTTANNQLAVFTQVIEFRDQALVVKGKKVKETQKRWAEAGPNGESVDTAVEETYTWEVEQ